VDTVETKRCFVAVKKPHQNHSLDQSGIGAFSRRWLDRPNVSGGMCGGTKAKPLALLLAADGFALMDVQFSKIFRCQRFVLICPNSWSFGMAHLFCDEVVHVPVPKNRAKC
jgi:hypothetical protein